MLKIIALLLLIFSCGAIGNAFAAALGGRARELKTLLIAMDTLQTEIDYAMTPLPNAFSRVAEVIATEKNLANMFLDLSGSFQQVEQMGLTNWRRIILEASGSLHLSANDLEPLIMLGDGLGLSDRADQIRRLRLAYALCEKNYQAAEEKRTSYAKLYRSFGWGLGAIIALLWV